MNHKNTVLKEKKDKKESWLDIKLTDEEIMKDLNYGRSSLDEPKTSCLNWSCSLGKSI